MQEYIEKFEELNCEYPDMSAYYNFAVELKNFLSLHLDVNPCKILDCASRSDNLILKRVCYKALESWNKSFIDDFVIIRDIQNPQYANFVYEYLCSTSSLLNDKLIEIVLTHIVDANIYFKYMFLLVSKHYEVFKSRVRQFLILEDEELILKQLEVILRVDPGLLGNQIKYIGSSIPRVSFKISEIIRKLVGEFGSYENLYFSIKDGVIEFKEPIFVDSCCTFVLHGSDFISEGQALLDRIQCKNQDEIWRILSLYIEPSCIRVDELYANCEKFKVRRILNPHKKKYRALEDCKFGDYSYLFRSIHPGTISDCFEF